MTMDVNIKGTFKGFNCQVQRAGNNETVDQDGVMAVKVCAMPDGQPQVLVMIRHADDVTNCAVLDHAAFLKLSFLLGNAGVEAAKLAQAASEATVQ